MARLSDKDGARPNEVVVRVLMSEARARLFTAQSQLLVASEENAQRRPLQAEAAEVEVKGGVEREVRMSVEREENAAVTSEGQQGGGRAGRIAVRPAAWKADGSTSQFVASF